MENNKEKNENKKEESLQKVNKKEEVIIKEVIKEVEAKPKYEKKNFLESRIVEIRPIIKKGKWSSIGTKDLDKPFLLENAVKIKVLPKSLSTQSYSHILDNKTKYITPQYGPEEPLTELEFFEKELNTDLNFETRNNPTNGKINFWGRDKRSKVKITSDGLELNTGKPLDYIHLKILQANIEEIAPNWESRFNRAEYEFAIVDREIAQRKEEELTDKKDRAYSHYITIKDKPSEMIDFMIVANNRTFDKSTSISHLRTEVTKERENNLDNYLKTIDNPNFEYIAMLRKAVISKAVEMVGAETYQLPGGQLIGTSTIQAIDWLRADENQEERMKIINRIERSGLFN